MEVSSSARSPLVSGLLPFATTSSLLGAVLTRGPFNIERFTPTLMPLVVQNHPMEKQAAWAARRRFARSGLAVNVLA
eukprot:5074653-Pyramimonas_sp.AAC.1